MQDLGDPLPTCSVDIDPSGHLQSACLERQLVLHTLLRCALMPQKAAVSAKHHRLMFCTQLVGCRIKKKGNLPTTHWKKEKESGPNHHKLLDQSSY